MAKGMPDWSTDLRIAQGAIGPDWFSDAAVLNDITTVHDMSGKGIVFGGYLRAYGSSPNPQNDSVRLYIDGTLVTNPTFTALYTWGAQIRDTSPIVLARYDLVNLMMTFAYGHGIVFNESIKVEFSHSGTNTVAPSLISELFHTLIT